MDTTLLTANRPRRTTPAFALGFGIGALALGSALADNPVVKMETTLDGEPLGTITIELDEENAPVSTENFLAYAKDGFFDGTVFHRVIDGFMIQGGGFAITGDGIQQKQSRSPIQNEAKNGLKNSRGTIAMARTPAPHSASSQFFINVNDNHNLDYPSFDGWGYAVFGKVVDGMDVVDKIKAQPTGVKKLVQRLPDGRLGPAIDSEDVPVNDIVITKVTVGAKADEAAAGEVSAEAAEEGEAAPDEGGDDEASDN